MNFIPYNKNIEKFIEKYIIIFTFIVLYQGTMGAQAFKTPKVIQNMTQSWIFNFIGLFSIAFTASKDIETALIATAFQLRFNCVEPLGSIVFW